MWSAIEIASSVDMLGQYRNWSGSRVSGMMELMCAMTSLSKHFMVTDMSGTVTVVLQSLWQVASEFLGTGMMRVSLRRGDYRLVQGEVENDSEDACQLGCARSENVPWNTVLPRGLASVD